MLNQFSNISCYEEFEIQCTLAGISKIDILKEIGHKVGNYYFFVLDDGVFNWFDLNGNHVEDPGILKIIKAEYIPASISKCSIPNSITHITYDAFSFCESLTSITIPNNVTSIGAWVFSYCKSLSSITIPDSVISIGNSVFVGCNSLTSITMLNSATEIGRYAFADCDSLKEVIFKGKTLDEVKQMENYPFGIEDENVFKCEIC